MEKMIQLDNFICCSLSSFISENEKENVEPLTSDEINLLEKLEMNDCIYVGQFFKVKRVK
mgnify:CR=1 FL=1|jgi:hypothetical protein|tara:strand:- start:91 stop:270 length:180 start_codon:yes stop_codon:yes gene_type:complete